MEPEQTIITAILGGLAKLNEMVIKDSYNALKKIITDKYGKGGEVDQALEGLEAKPDSKGRQETFKEEAEAAKIYQDGDVLAAAQRLLEQLNAQPGGPEMVQQIVNGNENIFSSTGNVNVTITNNSQNE